ncbi:MAG: sugar transferase [Thermoleophilia bacterium]|nr:sugar transferase [Thermoleophilia bacterium]
MDRLDPASGTSRGVSSRPRVLRVSDTVSIAVACGILSAVDASVWNHSTAEAASVGLVFAAVVLPLWFVLAGASGLYRRDEQRADLTVTDDVIPVVVAATLAAWSILVGATLTSSGMPDDLLVGLWAALAVCVLAGRVVARSITRVRPAYVQNTLIVGAGNVGQLLGRKLAQHPELGLRLVGFVDDDPRAMRRDLEDVPVLGTPDAIREIVAVNDVQRVIVAFSNESHDRQLELVHELSDLEVHVDLVPRLFEAIGPSFELHYIEGLPLVALTPRRSTRLARAAKRSMDVVLSATLIALLSPLIAFVAWRVKRGSPGPVFFRQERLGQGMKPFELLKFRTMGVDTDDAPHRAYVERIMDTSESPVGNNLYKLDREDAVTPAGAWLRRTSLDELPQLFNVFRGEMSLVGPRPCLQYECDLFEPHHYDRFLVPAGMTGLWQVTARARTTFREALDLDTAYARNWSLGLDLKLLLRTPFALLRGKGTA